MKSQIRDVAEYGHGRVIGLMLFGSMLDFYLPWSYDRVKMECIVLVQPYFERAGCREVRNITIRHEASGMSALLASN